MGYITVRAENVDFVEVLGERSRFMLLGWWEGRVVDVHALMDVVVAVVVLN